jgi:hypothetical protein
MRCTIKPDMSVRLSGLQTGKMKCLAIKRRREKHYAVIRVAGHSYSSDARGFGQSYAPAHIVITELKGFTVFHNKNEVRIEAHVDYPFMLEYQPRGMTQEEIGELFKQKER